MPSRYYSCTVLCSACSSRYNKSCTRYAAVPETAAYLIPGIWYAYIRYAYALTYVKTIEVVQSNQCVHPSHKCIRGGWTLEHIIFMRLPFDILHQTGETFKVVHFANKRRCTSSVVYLSYHISGMYPPAHLLGYLLWYCFE